MFQHHSSKVHAKQTDSFKRGLLKKRGKLVRKLLNQIIPRACGKK
jgi:hypothetical protein